MELASFDLNLLRSFDAFFRHHSISAAAEEMGFTQPGASAVLRRMRASFGNPLFVRTARGIKATPFADHMAPKIAAILEVLRELDRPSKFVAGTSELNFRLYVNDAGLMMLLPRLVQRLGQEAPLVKLTIADLRPDEVIDCLDKSQIDVAVGYFLRVPNWARQQKLRDTSYVCVVRADHPLIQHDLSLEQFLAGKHVMYWSHDAIHDTLERTLARLKLSRDVRLRVPRFSALPSLIAQSDLILTVPEDVAIAMARLTQIRTLKPPLPLARFQVRQYWHERLNTDPAHRWFRRMVKEETEKLLTDT